MMTHPVIPYLVAAVLFGLGCYGVLVRRNAVLLLMSVELMLNAVNLVSVTADTTVRARLPHTGGVFALFVIVLAAAEVGVGLVIVLQLYRLSRSVVLDTIALDPYDPGRDEPDRDDSDLDDSDRDHSDRDDSDLDAPGRGVGPVDEVAR